MASIIHFFRNRSLDRFDYEQLINHFTELENCEKYYLYIYLLIQKKVRQELMEYETKVIKRNYSDI